MNKFFKKLINLSITLIILMAHMHNVYASSISYIESTERPFSLCSPKGSIFEIILNTTYTNDIVFANNPSDLKVYRQPEDLQRFEVDKIPFLWEINRFGILNDDWSVVSYNNKKCYVKNEDIIKEKNYNIESYYYDNVFVDSETDNSYCKLYLNLSNSKILTNLNNGISVKRILSLDNGFSLVEYNNEKGFIKSSDLIKREYLGKFQITYYCPCNICNGGWGAYDYFGNPLKDGTAAVDTSIIPFGTSFQIEENGYTRDCIAKDIGGAIKGSHIDVFVNVPHSVCEQMGNSKKDVYTYIRCK